MMPAFLVLVAWLLFTGTHLGLSSSGVRAKFSPKGFVMLFGSASVLSMLPLIAVATLYGSEGVAGVSLDAASPIRWLLGVVALLGAIALVAGLLNYQRSPMATQTAAMRPDGSDMPLTFAPPGPIDRVTRHPFFVGLGVLAVVHIPLVSTLAGAVFFAGLAVHCFIGIGLQDAKLRARWRSQYEAYEAQTVVVPFSTPSDVASGSNRDQATSLNQRSGLVQWTLASALGIAVLGGLHSVWSWGNGAGFLIGILIFGSAGVLAGLLQPSRVKNSPQLPIERSIQNPANAPREKQYR